MLLVITPTTGGNKNGWYYENVSLANMLLVITPTTGGNKNGWHYENVSLANIIGDNTNNG
jgi:hypothetical protein